MPDWLKTIQNFITTEEGRWAAIGLASTLLFLLLLRATLRRWNRQPRIQANEELLENLATYPPAPPLPGDAKLLQLYGLPVRIRMMVFAPLGHDAGSIEPEEVFPLAEQMIPGLAERLRLDLPRIRLWPTQLSQSGFLAAFRRNTQVPDTEVRVRHWVLLMGKVLREGSPIAVGLAFQSADPHTLGPVVLQHAHQWMEVLRLERIA